MQEIEINHIDKRYESFRLKDKNIETRLLSSIIEKGILQPLSGIFKSPEHFILLDGFKRLRCAVKIKISYLSIEDLGTDEYQAILKLIQISNSRHLTTLEEAILVNEVYKNSRLSKIQIANTLERSPAWVSVRLGIIDEMSDAIKKAVFSGVFPLRSYMYTLRSFTRVKGFDTKEADDFVKKLSGYNLSVRDIDKLAYAYFNGSDQMKAQFKDGNFRWLLDQMKNVPSLENNKDFENDMERKMIHYLELLQKYMNFISRDISNSKLKSSNFIQNANLLIKGILDQQSRFVNNIRSFYVQTESEGNNKNIIS